MKLKMSLKTNVVGDLKFWKYFRTRFAGTHPPRLLVCESGLTLAAAAQNFSHSHGTPKNAKNLGCESVPLHWKQAPGA
jgi:hypothetical protein